MARGLRFSKGAMIGGVIVLGVLAYFFFKPSEGFQVTNPKCVDLTFKIDNTQKLTNDINMQRVKVTTQVDSAKGQIKNAQAQLDAAQAQLNGVIARGDKAQKDLATLTLQKRQLGC